MKLRLTQGLHRSVQQRPDEVMTVCGDRVRTFRESVDRIARLAGALQGLGVQGGARAAILSLNSDRYSEFLAATVWAGGVVVPVNLRWSVAEIADSLAEVGACVLVVDDAFAPAVPALTVACPRLEFVVHSGDGPLPENALGFEALIEQHQPVPDAERSGDDLAGVFYTGGTTGRAKGVMISHAGLMTSALGTMAGGHLISEGGTYLHAAPMFHLADIGAWVALVVRGGRHVMIPMFEPVAVLTAIQAHAVTDVLLVPTMVQLVVDHPRRAEFDLSSVQRILYGASPMPEAVLGRAMTALPNAQFTQIYGMTELSPTATVLTPADHEDPVRRRSAGRAALHAEVRVVGPDDVELPPGEVGEVVVRGGHLMLGYWERPVETAEALRGGWMHTGDGGTMDDEGYVFLVDRIKDMIITGGENVYSVEVENVLCQHHAVATAAVIGVPDDTWGERVHAVVVPVAGEVVDLDELTEFCRGRIAGYKTPKSMELVTALPLSAVGKVLKRDLREPYWKDRTRATASSEGRVTS